MFECDYLIEMLTPKKSEGEIAKHLMQMFAERYYRITDQGLGLSVPDNPMGQPRYSLLHMMEQAQLPIISQKTVMNLNTFHTKRELDELLTAAAKKGLKYLLIVRGDGGPRLSQLDPKSIGGIKSVATSIDLTRYIHQEYPGVFITGAAFNQYNSMPLEINRLEQKIAAGAKFVITQPVIGRDSHVDAILRFKVAVVIEAWMSRNIDLLYKSVRKKKTIGAESFEPVHNLQNLHDAYPHSCIYLSMLSFKASWKNILPKF